MSDEPRREMTSEESALADSIYEAIQRSANSTERGEQARSFRVGVSDLGYCSERTRRMLKGQHPGEEPDMLLAWIGTHLGAALEDAVMACTDLFPDAITQPETTTVLLGDKHTFNVLGHPDLVLPSQGMVIDAKTSYGLQLARRVGPDQQKQFQRHCYAAGAHDAGLFGDLPLSQVRVGNVWLDRSGMEKRLHVNIEPFDDSVLVRAAHWLDEVVEHYKNDTTAEKEPPRDVCAVTCGFFKECRAFDTDVSGLIEDPALMEAIDLYLEGQTADRFGTKAKAEAKVALLGVSGFTGTHAVRWVDVSPTEKRAGYSRLDIRELR